MRRGASAPDLEDVLEALETLDHEGAPARRSLDPAALGLDLRACGLAHRVRAHGQRMSDITVAQDLHPCARALIRPAATRLAGSTTAFAANSPAPRGSRWRRRSCRVGTKRASHAAIERHLSPRSRGSPRPTGPLALWPFVDVLPWPEPGPRRSSCAASSRPARGAARQASRVTSST